MECLENFIGIKQGCGASAPASGLYIENLPGISLQNIADATDSKYKNAVDLINQLSSFSAQEVFEDARIYLNDYIEVDLTDGLHQSGNFDGNYHVGIAAPRGIVIKWKKTELRTLRIPYIYLRSEQDAQDKEITIQDGNDSTVVTVPELIGGIDQVVQLDYVAKTENVQITWIDDNINVGDGYVTLPKSGERCGSCRGFTNYLQVNGYNDGSTTNRLYGIKSMAVIDCSLDNAICLVSSRLKMALLYKLGVRILEEWQASKRVNFLTISSAEWVDETIPKWEMKYDELMRQHAPGLSHFIKSLDSNCYKCGGISYGTTHP